jgi:DNA polymerase-3 subunit beta
MRFKVRTSDFQKAISTVEGVITVREVRSVLSNIKIEADKNRIYLSATDLEISIKTSIDAEILESGTTSIPAKQLSNTIKTINFSECEIIADPDKEGSKNKILITDSEGKEDYQMYINGIEGEEIKTISKVEDQMVVDFPCIILSEMIRKTYYAVAVEDTRFVFNGIHLVSSEGKIILVGTDGRRLAKVERTIPNTLPFSKGIIIPHKAIKEILKMIDGNEVGKIGVFESQVYIKINNTEILCKLIDGNYPDYEAVIPKESKFSSKINKERLALKLKQAMVSAEEPTRQLRLSLENNNLHISSSTQGTQEANMSFPIEYTGDNLTIAFKGDYLQEVTRSIDDAEVILGFSSSSSPAVFKDPSDPQYIAVIMPMKI